MGDIVFILFVIGPPALVLLGGVAAGYWVVKRLMGK